MTAGLLDKSATERDNLRQDFRETELCSAPCEVNKEELCKKLCLNILEGLLEGYERLKLKSSEKITGFESKILELKSEIDRQKVLY